MDIRIALCHTRRLCLPALLLACCLPSQAQAQSGASVSSSLTPGLEAGSSSTVAAPRGKQPRRKGSTRMSKATLAALQPGVGEHLNAEPLPAAGSVSAAMLSPVVKRSPDAPVAALADPLPTVGVDQAANTPLAKLLEPDSSSKKVSNKTRQLPSQEEGLALAKATSVPKASLGEGVSEEAEAKVEKGVESGPMRVRVRKQALQMSVEFPMFQ